MKTPLMLLLAICIGILTVTGTASSSELTPQQRALIFSKPKSVRALKKGVATISLEGTDQRGFYKCPYMHVYINGEGPFTFLFDTGSAFTVVSSKVVAKARIQLALDRGGYHDLLRVKKINVGELEIQDLIGVRDDDFGVDGVFGFKAFGDMNLVFRLADRQLVVSEKPVPLPDSFALPFKLDRNLPTIPVTVGTAQVPTLIDTGDDAYAWEIRSSDLTGAGLAHPPVPAGQVLNGAKQQTTFVSTLGSPVRLGPIVIDDAVVCINDG